MSNLSQQQQKHFWSKMIFEQQNQKNLREIFFSEKILSKTKFGKFFFAKKMFEKLFWKKKN